MKTYYYYGMRLRGFAPSCQPSKGFVECMTDDDKKKLIGNSVNRYHDVLVYDRELYDDEVEDYELDYLGDTTFSVGKEIAVSRWHTPDELPSTIDTVLIELMNPKYKDSVFALGCYYKKLDQWFLTGGSDAALGSTIKYWMEIPETPDQKGIEQKDGLERRI